MNRICLLIYLICLAGCMKDGDGAEPQTFDSLTCPKSQGEWQSWLKQEYKLLKASSFRYNGAHMSSVLERCWSDLALHPALAQNLQRLRLFTRGQDLFRREAHSLGLEQSDALYFSDPKAAPYLSLPADIASEEFLDAIDHGLEDNFSAAMALLAKSEAKTTALYFRSQNLPTADDAKAAGRFLIHYQTPDLDQFIQFGVNDDVATASTIPAQSVSLISIKTAANGDKTAYYNDYWRLRTAAGIRLSTRFKEVGSLEPCYACHSTALLPIVPDNMFDQASFGQALAQINATISKQALAKIQGIDLTKRGPALGPVKASWRTPAFIQNCSGGIVKEPGSAAKVAAAMQCSRCHNDLQRKALRFDSTGFAQITGGSLVKKMIVDWQQMPPLTALDPSEREALSQCLTYEYLGSLQESGGLLESWLFREGSAFRPNQSSAPAL